jgi:hypothetical protein
MLRLMPDEVTDTDTDIVGYFTHSRRTVVDTSQVPEILTVQLNTQLPSQGTVLKRHSLKVWR